MYVKPFSFTGWSYGAETGSMQTSLVSCALGLVFKKEILLRLEYHTFYCPVIYFKTGIYFSFSFFSLTEK